MGDLQRQLSAIERRARWKTALRVGGVILVGVGVIFLPATHQVFSERGLSVFSDVADTGALAGWGVACIAAGVLAVVVSVLIPGDVQD